jgi:hypothetical protein
VFCTNFSHAGTTNKLFGITSLAFCLHFASFLAMEFLIERRSGEELNGSCLPQLWWGGGWYKNHALINKTFLPRLMAFCFH